MIAPSVYLTITVLIGVLMLMAAAASLYKSGIICPPVRSGRSLLLVESIALDQRRRLHIVRCGKREVVLLTGGGQDLVIGWMPDQ